MGRKSLVQLDSHVRRLGLKPRGVMTRYQEFVPVPRHILVVETKSYMGVQRPPHPDDNIQYTVSTPRETKCSLQDSRQFSPIKYRIALFWSLNILSIFVLLDPPPQRAIPYVMRLCTSPWNTDSALSSLVASWSIGEDWF